MPPSKAEAVDRPTSQAELPSLPSADKAKISINNDKTFPIVRIFTKTLRFGKKQFGKKCAEPSKVCRFISVVQVAICQVRVSIQHLVSAHGAMGERPWGGGRAPMGRWACAHGAVGADFLGEKNGIWSNVKEPKGIAVLSRYCLGFSTTKKLPTRTL